MAKDRTPQKARPSGAGKGGNGSRAAGGKGGRTRPVNTVVTQQKPWGLIAGALAVVLFAAAVITYAVAKVNEANENRVDAVSDIAGIQEYEFAAGQEHVTTPVEYTENPPVGGPHDGRWADCTGTVYDVDIRHENAVHSLEHGAVWITYNPDEVSDADIEKLAELVDGVSGRMLSPYAGLDSPISLQSWNHQLKVDSAGDERVVQFADFLTRNSDFHPEVLSDADVERLAELVDGVSGRMLSPYEGLDSPISLQSWNHQLKVDSVDDERIEQFADFLTRNSDFHPEVGASCENPAFLADPLVAGDESTPVGSSDMPTTTAPETSGQ